MSVRSSDLVNGQPAPRKRLRVSGSQVAAVLAWLGAVYTTYIAILGLQPSTPWHVMLPVAAVVQFVLTMAEGKIMTARPGIFTIAVFVVDSLINAGGVFPFLRNVGATPTAAMFAEVGVRSDVSALPAVLLSILAGGIIAVAPEALWRMDK